MTVPETMRVTAFRPVAPLGTHHTVLTTITTGTDRVFDCNGFINGPHMLYGSGLGTTALDFPAGVAVTLQAGTKLLLNLHLFNTSPDGVLTGHSGIEVLTVPATGVVEEAQSILMGTENINLPAGITVVHGGCPVQSRHTVFALFPHMHQTATHMTVVLEHPGTGAASQVLMDDDYTFDNQTYRLLPTPLEIAPGDHVKVDCTYDNETGRTVHYGESSTDEMCYTGVYFFPPLAGTGAVTCTE